MTILRFDIDTRIIDQHVNRTIAFHGRREGCEAVVVGDVETRVRDFAVVALVCTQA